MAHRPSPPAAVARRSDDLTARWVPDVLRWAAGLLWLSNVSWKVSPDFASLGRYLDEGIANPVTPGSSWLFEHVLSPNLTLFGWSTVLIETALAALLISGRHVRVAGVLGVVQSLGIGLAVANAEGEWYWSYALMIVLHLAVLATAGQMRRPSLRTNGLVLVGYGAIVAMAHAGAGFTGDENATWSLFDQRNDFPGDFGRNVFPGSILFGLILIALGVAAALGMARLGAVQTRVVGAVLLVVAVAVLVFVTAPRVDGWLGMRNSSVAMVAVLGLTLLHPRSGSSRR